ncbi:hypothetical protein [Natronobacterium texcoconense]|uniref:Uncharacterized protein n=1 Tax=Natronobacterium texcoconense TaxID=1095778 RepID=A0A1H1HN42_NATTX|nr:hypothetical protein [Natronobacterium texcoconense]SDR26568.1 hypothetical protein SAMN04489842_2880 [Natronobacterium texcoconense]
MGAGTKLLLAVLGIVLVIALLSANLVVATDRTVLDSEFVKDTAEEEGLYAVLAEEIQGSAQQSTPASSSGVAAGSSHGDIVQTAVTEEEIQTQGEENIDRLYAFLHGETDELRLEIDLDGISQNVIDELEDEMADPDLRDAGFPQGEEIEEMAASEEQFDQHREEFREEQKERMQGDGDREVSDEELDERMESIRMELYTERDERLQQEFHQIDDDADIEEPAHALMTARIDALTGEIEYDEYVVEVESAKEEFGNALVAAIEDELENEDKIDLTEDMDDDAMEPLEMGQEVVSIVSLLAIALPLVTLGIVGLMAWLSSPSTAAISTGFVSTLVGTAGVAGAYFAGDQLESLLAGGDAPAAMTDFALGIVSGVLDALTVQSVVLLVAGIGLIVVGIAVRRGLILEN